MLTAAADLLPCPGTRTLVTLAPGDHFGAWEVLALAGRDPRHHVPYYHCRCACGTVALVNKYALLRGASVRCRACATRQAGLRRCGPEYLRSPEYRRWYKMTAVCHDPRHASYPHYGGRGVRVCERWRTSFLDFLADVGRVPPGRPALLRRDPDGPYDPANCFWGTLRDKARGTRRRRVLTFAGVTLNVSDWAAVAGLPREALAQRIRKGWPAPEALAWPLGVPRLGGGLLGTREGGWGRDDNPHNGTWRKTEG